MDAAAGRTYLGPVTMAQGDTPDPRLQRLRPEGAPERFADAERHKRLVRRLKIALPLAAIACIAAIFISLAFTGKGGADRPPGSAPAIEMEAPVLTGFSATGKPYELRAARSVQTRQGVIELTAIKGSMTLEDGAVSLEAASGTVLQETQQARVSGGVVVTLDNGYRFETESAEADLKAGIITGRTHVKVTGPMGVSEAEGFVVEKSVRRVIFTGGVRSVIEPAKAGEAAP